MMQSIIAINNAAAFALSKKGEEIKALKTLRDALELLLALCNASNFTQKLFHHHDHHSSDSSSGRCDLHHQKPNRCATHSFAQISVFPVTNDDAHDVEINSSNSQSMFLYNHGLGIIVNNASSADQMTRRIPTVQLLLPHHLAQHDDSNDDMTEATILGISATVMYNMALAYHRLAAPGTSYSQEQRQEMLSKAIQAYHQANEISQLEIQRCGGVWCNNNCNNESTNVAFHVAVVSHNNMGQIYHDNLQDDAMARFCFEFVAHIIMSGAKFEQLTGRKLSSYSRLMHIVVGKNCKGILSNLMILCLLTGTVAPAA